MKTQFAVLNPTNGEYTYVDTAEELAQVMVSHAYDFYLSQTHGNPVSVVQTNDAGAETWFTLAGERIPTLEEIQASMSLKMKNIQSMQDAAALDVTRLGE